MSAAPLDFDDDETDPLELLGDLVTAPEPDPGDEARDRLAATDRDLGRLTDLAAWWADVRADAAAAPPQRVVAVGVADDVPLPAGVDRRVLDQARPADPADPADPTDPTAPADPAEPLTSFTPFTLDADRTPQAADPFSRAVDRGAALADECADTGTDLVLFALRLGLPGRALTGYLMGLDPVETNGWPTGPTLDDDGWMDQVEQVRDTQWALRGLRGRPIAMVRALSDQRLATAAGFLLRSAARRTPVLLDGPGATTAGLLAARCSRVAPRWWVAADLSDEPLFERSLDSLGLTAVNRLGVRDEDGTAAAAALGPLTLAASFLTRA